MQNYQSEEEQADQSRENRERNWVKATASVTAVAKGGGKEEEKQEGGGGGGGGGVSMMRLPGRGGYGGGVVGGVDVVGGKGEEDKKRALHGR